MVYLFISKNSILHGFDTIYMHNSFIPRYMPTIIFICSFVIYSIFSSF